MHARGEENTAKNASPCVSTSLPSCAAKEDSDQRVMASEYLRVNVFTQPPEQRRRALNVGKQKRESLHEHSVERPARKRQLPAGKGPALDEGPHEAEVNPEGGVRPGAGAGVTVEQYHQPGTDVAAEFGGQFTGAAIDPDPDRRGGVVVQQLQLGEDLSDPGG